MKIFQSCASQFICVVPRGRDLQILLRIRGDRHTDLPPLVPVTETDSEHTWQCAYASILIDAPHVSQDFASV